MTVTAYAARSEMTSPLWARAFVDGCGGTVAERNELQPGDVALFGSPVTWCLLQQAQQEGRTWYYGDHGYFGRHNAPIGGPGGKVYYRTTRNAYQHDGSGDGDAVRFARLGVPVKPWRMGGNHILLCPNSPGHFALHGGDCGRWIADTTAALRKHTDREIKVRVKTAGTAFADDLRGAWAVVVYTSACGFLAALEGVPCFATAHCASGAFGSTFLHRIESPHRPDNRYELACVLAAHQWTAEEMRQGMAWERLQ